MKKCIILFLILAAGCNYGPGNRSGAKRAASKPAYDVTADTKANRAMTSAQWKAEVLDSKEPVLVDFWAPWCPPCMAMSDTIENLAQEFKVVKVNVDNNPDLMKQYNVESIPMMLVFQNGEIAQKFLGLTEEHELRKAMQHVRAKK